MDLGNLELSGRAILLTGSVITGILLLLTFFLKRQLRRRARQPFHKEATDLAQRTKYSEVNAFRWSGTLFNLGLATALGMVLLAFSWTSYDTVATAPDGYFDQDIDLMLVPPPTDLKPPPPPPPPPPPLIEPVPEDEPVDDREFLDTSIEAETEVIAEPVPTEPAQPLPPPPPPPPTPKAPVVEIFKRVEKMPRFPGCEEVLDESEGKKCMENYLFTYLRKELKYPPIARENGVQGTVYVQFVVETDGSITQAQVVREPGAGTGPEALRVIEKMPKWNPGEQRGNKVRVQFTLPVRFRLE